METALKAFQALADPTRLAVFQCIRCCGDEGRYEVSGCTCGDSCTCTCCSVPLGDVREQVCCSPSNLTHHLNILRDAGLIATERRGRVQFVRAVPEALEEIVRFLQERPPRVPRTEIQTEEIAMSTSDCSCGSNCNCGPNCCCGSGCCCGK